MTKLIGLKELQKNTKQIREEVAEGMNFIVIYRSKPIFEIKPLPKKIEFAEDIEATGLYTDDFIKRMKKAENDVMEGKVKTYTTEEFLKSLS